MTQPAPTSGVKADGPLAVIDELLATYSGPLSIPFPARKRVEAARAAVAELAEAAAKFKREYDSAQADAEGEWLIQPDAGCYECTLHTVPHNRDTGLCGYHKLERALARISP